MKVSKTDKRKCRQRHTEMERDGAEIISQGTGGITPGQVQELFHVLGHKRPDAFLHPQPLNNLSKLMQPCLCTAQTLQCIMQSTGSNPFSTQAGETHASHIQHDPEVGHFTHITHNLSSYREHH